VVSFITSEFDQQSDYFKQIAHTLKLSVPEPDAILLEVRGM